MSDPPSSLHTRWSMLEGLRGREAEESWRWFIDRYRPFVRACVARVIPLRERAERAADEIWSYLFTSSVLENADRSRCFRTYLAGTVRNFARGWLRGNPNPGVGDVQEDPSTDATPARELEEEEMRLWKKQVVQLALGELARRHAEQVHVLRWFYGLPAAMEEEGGTPQRASWIAAQLGIQTNAVHQIVFRGRKRLRACIENELRETVRNTDDLDDEIRSLYTVLEEENPGLGA